MGKVNDTEKKIEEIDDKIVELIQQKIKLSHQDGMIYCPICKKLYPSKQCKQGPEMFGSFLEAWNITCPKGHTWDDK